MSESARSTSMRPPARLSESLVCVSLCAPVMVVLVDARSLPDSSSPSMLALLLSVPCDCANDKLGTGPTAGMEGGKYVQIYQ